MKKLEIGTLEFKNGRKITIDLTEIDKNKSYAITFSDILDAKTFEMIKDAVKENKSKANIMIINGGGVELLNKEAK